jgi:probable rRNA maturation factor
MLELVLAGKPEDLNLQLLDRLVKSLNRNHPKLLEGKVNLKLVDDAAMQALNRDYGGRDEPTDVLAFSYIENGQPAIEGEIGDIAVSLDTARRQASKVGLSLPEELTILTLHGLLHLHGLDHATDLEQAKLSTLQRSILDEAGLPYRPFEWHD